MGRGLPKAKRVRRKQEEGEKEPLGRLKEKQTRAVRESKAGEHFRQEGRVPWLPLLMRRGKAEHEPRE